MILYYLNKLKSWIWGESNEIQIYRSNTFSIFGDLFKKNNVDINNNDRYQYVDVLLRS
jgi:hypothetical protein